MRHPSFLSRLQKTSPLGICFFWDSTFSQSQTKNTVFLFCISIFEVTSTVSSWWKRRNTQWNFFPLATCSNRVTINVVLLFFYKKENLHWMSISKSDYKSWHSCAFSLCKIENSFILSSHLSCRRWSQTPSWFSSPKKRRGMWPIRLRLQTKPSDPHLRCWEKVGCCVIWLQGKITHFAIAFLQSRQTCSLPVAILRFDKHHSCYPLLMRSVCL